MTVVVVGVAVTTDGITVTTPGWVDSGPTHLPSFCNQIRHSATYHEHSYDYMYN